MGIAMNVEILEFETGAREAARRHAVTIVVDALRASATATTALAMGATSVIPVNAVEVAQCYVGLRGYRVAGERNAITCDGFDFGNSPTQLRHHQSQLLGHQLVLTTSNGTRMVHTARQGAAALLLGTTLNGQAVATAAYAVARQAARPIVILAAGEFDVRAEEDLCAARHIAGHLADLGAQVPPRYIRDEDPLAVFEATPSAEELRHWGFEEDVAYCAQRDLYDIAPLLIDDRFVPYQAAHAERAIAV